jgi:hypothetical protein
MGQDKAMIKKAFKQHDMQEHKGGKGTSLKLKHGGKMATGGVVNGQGGFKKGGAIAKSGIINTEGQGGAYRDTKMHTAKPNNNSAPTGEVKLGNGGGYKKGGKIKGMMGGGMMGDGMMNDGMPTGYKKGGASKKHYATGGAVNNSGHAVAMPKKAASRPVSNDRQSGTFKTGGSVTPAQKKEQSAFKAENATAMKQAKAYSNEKYGRKMQSGGSVSDKEQKKLDKAYNDSIGPDNDDMDIANAIRGIPAKLFGGVKSLIGMDDKPKAGSVTKTEKSVTVAPAKKRGGSVTC